MKAIWGSDYDFRNDKIYRCPCCPECNEPIGEYEDGYRCFSCQKKTELDEDMKEWFAERSGTKVEYTDCTIFTFKDKRESHTIGCGGKDTYKNVYVRDKVTKKWRWAWGKCEKCGQVSLT